MPNVLIDTDIGDDVDDAFALALAARLAEIHIVGVTTTCGRGRERAALARVVLEAAGQPPIPIASGATHRCDGLALPARFSHGDVIAGRPLESAGLEATALLQALAARYAPLTIVALGPLTNLAAALRTDPTLAKRVQVVAMAGKLGLPYPDWNLRCDPQAARVVLAAGLPVTLVGMHLTLRCKTTPQQLAALFATATEPAPTLARCVLAWRTRKRRLPYLHDALAVAVSADPTLMQSAPRRILVGRGGVSVALRHEQPNALVGLGFDRARFTGLLDAAFFGSARMTLTPSRLARLLLPLA